MTRGRLLDRIRVVLAGRAAEEVALGQPSTYGTSDLRVGLGLEALGVGRRFAWSWAGKFHGAFPKEISTRLPPRPRPGGPHPGTPCPQDATRLAVRLVANYGMSEAGITTYAPVPTSLGFMQRSFQVTGAHAERLAGARAGCQAGPGSEQRAGRPCGS